MFLLFPPRALCGGAYYTLPTPPTVQLNFNHTNISILPVRMPERSMDGRQRWLDGLRGVAAVIVAWFHFTVGEMKIPYRGFNDEPAEQNRHIIQLPPFRILYAGKAMVTLFFVISGYSVPLAIIRRRSQNNNADCYRKLTSSVIRRGFRLYLPIILVCMTSQILFFMGAYSNWSFPRTEGCPRAPPWSAI
jgi:peptidoglycan/LPS O-acetylase OafA/YrhL